MLNFMFWFDVLFFGAVVVLWVMYGYSKCRVHFDHADQVPAIGMRKIVLRAPRQFYMIIGFWYRLPFGFSVYIPYGVERSGPDGVAVIDTFLGEKGCRFTFITSINTEKNDIVVSSDDEEQSLNSTSQHTKWPWQK